MSRCETNQLPAAETLARLFSFDRVEAYLMGHSLNETARLLSQSDRSTVRPGAK